MNGSHRENVRPFGSPPGSYHTYTFGRCTPRDKIVSGLLVGAGAAIVGMSVDMLPFSWFALVYISMSLVTFALYAEDKRRSRRREWRVAELTLHKLELCGGWPGALLAQWYIRHKIAKTNYRRVTLAVAACHSVAWVILWHCGLFPF